MKKKCLRIETQRQANNLCCRSLHSLMNKKKYTDLSRYLLHFSLLYTQTSHGRMDNSCIFLILSRFQNVCLYFLI